MTPPRSSGRLQELSNLVGTSHREHPQNRTADGDAICPERPRNKLRRDRAGSLRRRPLRRPRRPDVGPRHLAAQDRAEASCDIEAFDRLDQALHRTLPPDWARDCVVAQSARQRPPRARTPPQPAGAQIPGRDGRGDRAIIAAVADHDAERAESALRHHLRMLLSSLPSMRAAHPGDLEES
jgi:hypothetical protein